MALATGKLLSERKSYTTAYEDYLANKDLADKNLIKSGEPPKGAIVYFGQAESNAYYTEAVDKKGNYTGNYIKDAKGKYIKVDDGKGNYIKVYGGHVGISDGKGNLISVMNTKDGVKITPLTEDYGAPIVGWVTPEERK